MNKKTKKSILCIVFFLLLISLCNKSTSGQSESEAYNSIQQAKVKLTDIVKKLEKASIDKIEVIDLAMETDEARQLIAEAWIQYQEAKYQLSYNKSETAINLLENIENEIDLRENTQNRNNKIIYSFIGIFSALATVFILYIYLKKIHPWYKSKVQEEYGKLEIIYPNKEEVKE